MRPPERPQPSPRQSQGIFSKNKASCTRAARRGAAVDAGADGAGRTRPGQGRGRAGRARGRRAACAAGPRADCRPCPRRPALRRRAWRAPSLRPRPERPARPEPPLLGGTGRLKVGYLIKLRNREIKTSSGGGGFSYIPRRLQRTPEAGAVTSPHTPGLWGHTLEGSLYAPSPPSDLTSRGGGGGSGEGGPGAGRRRGGQGKRWGAGRAVPGAAPPRPPRGCQGRKALGTATRSATQAWRIQTRQGGC